MTAKAETSLRFAKNVAPSKSHLLLQRRTIKQCSTLLLNNGAEQPHYLTS